MYRSILLPLDGSDHAAKALPHAAGLARDGGRLTLLRVIHPIEELVGTRQPDLLSGVDLSEDVRAQEAFEDERAAAQRYLDETSKSLSREGFEVQVKLVQGPPAEQILQVAQEIDADLVVMTAYGRSAASTPPKTGVFGRVVDAVLKSATVPVLVIKPWG